jgi:hypothetical protein
MGLWIDEPGQIDDSVWRAIQPRIMVHRARVLLTSRPMLFNWYVREFWHDVIDVSTLRRLPDAPEDREVINYPSTANPQADHAFIESERSRLPDAEYRMRYLGIPTRPAGLVYDCWTSDLILDAGGVVPDEWARYVGIDFGPDNTCAVFLAAERVRLPSGEWGPDTGRYVLYGAWLGGRLTPEEYARHWRPIAGRRVEDCRGGSATEDGWRGWLSQAWPVGKPVCGSVEVGIQHVYRLIKERKLFITRDAMGVIKEIESYAYALDDAGNSTGRLDPKKKSAYHHLDALRYIAPCLVPNVRRGYEGFGVGDGVYGLS